MGSLVLLSGFGCATSSHKSVRTYDYSNEPRPARPESRNQKKDSDANRADGEWQMVSPGEMVVDSPNK